MNNSIIPYGIPTFLLTYNGLKFFREFFAILCRLMGTKHVTKTSFHPQTNGQKERYNKTMAARLRHYVAGNQRDWDKYLQPLTYAYNIQVHRSTNMAPCGLVLSRKPPGPNTVTKMKNFPPDMNNVSPAARLVIRLMVRMTAMIKTAKYNMSKAKLIYKSDYYKKVTPIKDFHVLKWYSYT